MGFNFKEKSIRLKIILAFTIIMVITILSIKIFMKLSFEKAFEKYVDDSNKAEIKHLMFDLKSVYKNGKWDVDTIKALGEDAILKGIALEIYNSEKKLVWSVFDDERSLSNDTLKKISRDMQSIDKGWNDKFVEYKTDIKDDNGLIVGYPKIGYYASTYFMENDIAFFKVMNKFIFVITIISILSIVVISIVISRSISNPILKISKMTKIIESGDYKDKLDYKSNIREVDELILSINKLATALNNQEELRKRLTTDISHELRTPITTIKGHLDVIIAGIWKPTKDRLVSISEEVSRLNLLIDELSNLAKYDSDQYNIKLETVDLKEILINIINNFEGKALEKNIIICKNIKPIVCKIDKSKFTQGLVNIISNAIKYTDKNGKLEIYAYEDDYINISIKDNGMGIPYEDQKYIFERFYRVDKSRNKNTGGIGIGLSITDKIIKAHKGEIILNSELGSGSEFIIKIPK